MCNGVVVKSSLVEKGIEWRQNAINVIFIRGSEFLHHTFDSCNHFPFCTWTIVCVKKLTEGRPICLKTRIPRTLPITAWNNICVQALGGTLSITQRRQCCNGRKRTVYVINTVVTCSVPVSQLLTHKSGSLIRKRNRPFLLCQSLHGSLSCSNNLWTCRLP